MPHKSTVMPRACAASITRLKLAFTCATGTPRRPSLAPSSITSTRTSPSSSGSNRRSARDEVSPEIAPFTISNSRPWSSSFSWSTAGNAWSAPMPRPDARLSPSTTIRGRAASRGAAEARTIDTRTTARLEKIIKKKCFQCTRPAAERRAQQEERKAAKAAKARRLPVDPQRDDRIYAGRPARRNHRRDRAGGGEQQRDAGEDNRIERAGRIQQTR